MLVRALALGTCLLVACGCGGGSSAPRPEGAKVKGEEEHAHERGKLLIADAGKYHALLTARLSPKGHELDVFFETTDREPEPVAVPLESFTAYAYAQGEDKPRELLFECTPAARRPKQEKPGTCSHFVAKAPWLKPTDTLEVIAPLKLDGQSYRVAWKGFSLKKYAHHEE